MTRHFVYLAAALFFFAQERRVTADELFSCVAFPGSKLNLVGTTVPTVGTNKLIFFRVRFPNDRSDPISVMDAEAQLAEAAAILKRVSKGHFQIQWTISTVLQFQKSRESYGDIGGFDRFIDDARAAGLTAGYDYRDYDLDIVRHSGVPGFMGGNANLGSRGAQIQADGAVIIVHELGHNLGLHHANTWLTGSESISAGSPPLPSNYPGVPDPRSIPVYPDSFLGHENRIGPGKSSEYGDQSDIMGSGSFEFSAFSRHALGWLDEQSVSLATNRLSLHKIQGTDGTIINPSLPRAVRISKILNTPLGEREYWVQLPSLDPQNPPLFDGVQIRWGDPLGSGDRTQLLEPSSGPIDKGLMLVPGRTFSDDPNGVHITLLSASGEENERSAEIAVFIGTSHSNRPPVIVLGFAPLSTGVHEPIALHATASDPDGDALSWHWDFGDFTVSTGATNVTKAWRRVGDFVVQLVVSDLKGGEARIKIPVRVGNPGTLRVSGRILTPDGKPVAGVRVHNGEVDAGTGLNRYRYTFSDSEGSYALADLLPGTYDVGAFLFGYSVQRRAPVTIAAQDLTEINFEALALPVVTISAPEKVSEADGFTNLFLFTRDGSLDEPLTVLFRLGGTANSGLDYVRPFVDRVTFPRGSSTIALPIELRDDSAGESEETISVALSYPTQSEHVDDLGKPYFLYFPGYELALINGVTHWVQTDPAYIPGPGASASVSITDNDDISPVTVAVSADSTIAIENPTVNSAFFLHRTGNSEQPLTVSLALSGSAENGLDYATIVSSATFAAKENELIIPVQPLVDGVTEGEEQVMLTILPGESYGVEGGAATVYLRDSSAVPQTLSATLRVDGKVQLTLKAKPGSLLVLEGTSDLAYWVPIRTNFLFNSDTAVLSLPPSASNSFFRTLIK